MSIQPFERTPSVPLTDTEPLPDSLGSVGDELMIYTDDELRAAGVCLDGLESHGLSARTLAQLRKAEEALQDTPTEALIDCRPIGQLAIESMMRRVRGLPDDTTWL